MKVKLIITVLLTMLGVVVGFAVGQITAPKYPSELEIANYDTIPYKIELIDAYSVHYNNVEALLDSIYNDSERYFCDVLMETDVYYEYELSKNRIDSLYSEEQ